MITKLNLSSNPFRNRALPWTVTAVIILFSVVALVFIAKWTFDTNAKAQTAARDVNELRKQTNELNKRAEEIRAALTPEQERALKSAHTLVNRKQFSWSRLFADLENALPANVRVTRIAVKEVRAEADSTVANLELVVASKSPAYVTQMIEDMARQGIFQPELVTQNPRPGQGEAGQEYELNVNYQPRAGAPLASDGQSQTNPAAEGAGKR